MSDSKTAFVPGAVQRRYARVLAIGTYSGLGLLILTFTLYVSGIVEPLVPIRELPDYWELPVDEYVEAIHRDHFPAKPTPTGWSWVHLLGHGDYLNFLGLALLALITIICYAAVAPKFYRQGRKVYAAIAFTEVIILVLAASGLIGGGH